MSQKNFPLNFEECACDWCGETAGDLVLEGPDRQLDLPGQFRMVRCQKCGLIRQNPRPTWDTLQHYYEGYTTYVPLIREYPEWQQRIKRMGPAKRTACVAHYAPGGRLLDVGCGSGRFLEEAQRRGGWELEGLEPSAGMADYVRRSLNLTIHDGVFNEASLPEAHYDVITLWNVLEHLDSPVEDLRRCHRLLKPGGYLFLTIPNLEGWERRVFGRYWLGWELPRHLYLFPRKVMKTILGELDFRVAGLEGSPSSHFALEETLNYWFKDWAEPYRKLGPGLLWLYRTPISRLSLMLPLGLLERLSLNTLITVIAQKKA